jgi:hypothetical protein
MREGLEQLCVQILKLRVSEYNQHMHYKVVERWAYLFRIFMGPPCNS